MYSRPRGLVIGGFLLVLLSVANLASLALPSGNEGAPIEARSLGVVLGVVGLVAAAGLWRGKRWALVGSALVLILNVLSAAPGIAFAPSAEHQLAASATIAVSILALVLVLTPRSRRFCGA